VWHFWTAADGRDCSPGAHQEDTEKREHPLNRIMGVEEDDEAIIIKTTDIHLPRRIGAAVRRAFHGRPEENFDASAYLVRVTWTADR
jgi:hypothetical protein